MNKKYIIFSLIMLSGTSCHGAACWRTSARECNTQKIERLARQKQVDPKQAALFMAAINDNIDELERAIQNGVNVDTRDKDGNTPLMEAAANNNGHAVKVLLKAQADSSLLNKKGEMVRNIAYAKNADTVKPILAKAEQIQDQLYNAAVAGCISTLEDAVKNGAVVNTPDFNGLTALHWAAYYTQPSTINALLQNGADANKSNRDGRTPIMESAARNDLEAVKLLLKSGANISLTDKNGETALDLAKKHKRYEIIKILENCNDTSPSRILENVGAITTSDDVDGTASGYESYSDQ